MGPTSPPAAAPSTSEKRSAASESAPTAPPGAAGQATAAQATAAQTADSHAQATVDQVEQLRRELASTPAAVVIANHAYGLFELAAIHLSEQPPRLEDAQLAVDAFGGLVESVGARLGDAAPALRDALAQIRLAFVQISSNAATANGENQSPPA